MSFSPIFMRPLPPLTALTLCLAAPAFAAPMACDGLTPEAMGLTGVTFTDVATVPAGEDSPAAQCRVRGHTAERTGTDGKPYALSFELALPDDWNGDFVHQFNGGNDGEVDPATGALRSGTGDMAPLARGFAVISSDAGHDGKANPDMGLAGAAGFGFDFEARQMYGYKAVEILQPLALRMVEAYYGQPVAHSYGIGCSNGGRHAMVAASRMPDAFDGLLVAAPGFNLPRSAVQSAVDLQTLSALTGDIRTSLSRDDMALVAAGVLAACDALDGLEDGLVQDNAACQQAFDITSLQCAEGQSDQCLAAPKVAALQAVFAGATGADGQLIYSEKVWDGGIGGANWRAWKIESTVPPWDSMPITAVMGASSLAQIFTVPPTHVGSAPTDLIAASLAFDPAVDAQRIFATSDEFPESPMQLMTPPDAEDPTLQDFQDATGRMIIVHGSSDPIFSVSDTARWYDRLNANLEGMAGDFVRFYPVPGMNHCSGGPATDAFDLLTPLIEWVENGTAPEAVIATARADNAELPEALQGASRPLCPAPLIARYQGGDPKSADSFQCQ
ncbi:tannase/feruloyl esterase family alpha/beta hydrolase [Paracoccus sp. (in: a-proteobacteria)]|uniref:tannase/feruloyl esterase family alpha/beta hydrolase n=1 Tax=Paracoccus sp. TaxID=267 RepID=UPI003A88E6B7